MPNLIKPGSPSLRLTPNTIEEYQCTTTGCGICIKIYDGLTGLEPARTAVKIGANGLWGITVGPGQLVPDIVDCGCQDKECEATLVWFPECSVKEVIVTNSFAAGDFLNAVAGATPDATTYAGSATAVAGETLGYLVSSGAAGSVGYFIPQLGLGV